MAADGVAAQEWIEKIQACLQWFFKNFYKDIYLELKSTFMNVLYNSDIVQVHSVEHCTVPHICC